MSVILYRPDGTPINITTAKLDEILDGIERWHNLDAAYE